MKTPTFFLITFLIITGLVVRYFVATQLSFTNDEGAYLYDAFVFSQGQQPIGDIVTKAPLFLLLLSALTWLLHMSLYAGRLFSTLFWILSLFPIWYIAEKIADKKTALIALSLWLLSSGTISLFTLGHTQILAAFFTLSALALAVKLKNTAHPNTVVIALGATFALAFVTRKTSIAAIVPALYLMFFLKPTLKVRSASLLYYLLGTGLMFLFSLVPAVLLYGQTGIIEATGLNYGRIIITNTLHSSQITPWGGGFKWVTQTIARIATINIQLVLLGLALAVQYLARQTIPFFTRFGWLLCAAIAFLGVFTLPPGGLIETLMQVSWIIFCIYAIFHAIWLPKILPQSSTLLLLGSLWVLVLVILYAGWPVILVDYMADFLPAATLVGASALAALAPSRKSVIAFSLFLSVTCALSLISIWQRPWTGMFTARAINDMALQIQQSVPSNESIFTAAAIVPYVARVPIAHNISHPLWYRFSFIDEDTKASFLPALDQLTSEMETGHYRWLLTDQLTDYAYFYNASPLRQARRANQWEKIITVDNNTGFRNNPLTLWRLSNNPTN